MSRQTAYEKQTTNQSDKGSVFTKVVDRMQTLTPLDDNNNMSNSLNVVRPMPNE